MAVALVSAPVVNLGDYLLGLALALVVIAAVTYLATGLRARFAPMWSSAPARLAESVIALTVVVAWSEIVGTVGGFRRTVIAGGLALVGAVGGWWCRRGGERGAGRAVPDFAATRRSPRVDVVVASIAVLAVAAQWLGKVAYAYAHGMTHPDTLWYHGPYAVEFAQRSRLLGLLDGLDPLHSYAGHTSELLHAVFILLVGRDLASPLVNVTWAALALTAAWCVGRRHGLGARCVFGAALVLGLPTVVATQPGQASNDVMTAALLLVAFVLLSEGDLALGPTVLAGLAAGLAVSTKVTVLAPVAVLTVAVTTTAVRRRVVVPALGWWVALALTGSYWFVRNIKLVHNPFPYYSLHLGPFTWSRVPQHHAPSVVESLSAPSAWSRVFEPGLHTALGALWPLVILGLVAAVAVAFRPPAPFVRAGAIAFTAATVAYLFTPYTGDGLAFTYNVRYATPGLLGSFALLPLATLGRAPAWRIALFALGSAVIVVDLLAPNREHVPAWSQAAWVVVPVVVVLGGVLVWWRPPKVRRTVVAGGALVVLVVGGWFGQRFAFDHRYDGAGLPDARINAWLTRRRHVAVGHYGTAAVYPFYGAALDNRPTSPQPATVPVDCVAWVRVLAQQDYVVRAHQPYVIVGPDDRWLDPRAFVPIVRDGSDRLYRVTPFARDADAVCAASGAGVGDP